MIHPSFPCGHSLSFSLCEILDICDEKGWSAAALHQKTKSPHVLLSAMYRFTRATASHPSVKIEGTPLLCRSFDLSYEVYEVTD